MVAASGPHIPWPPIPSSPRRERVEAIADLTGAPLDLLVVGGGITGAGIMRDAALRGLRVGLVDKGDYGQGTSSRSSKLVHGGLRYLDNLEFSLVFEGTRERYIQRRLNPNLVWPLPFVFPVYEDSPNGLWKVNLGLWLYDLLSIFRAYRRHRRLGATATRAHVPGLREEGLQGCVTYFDCRTDDARLTLENVLSGVAAGGHAVNHVAFLAPEFQGERVVGARLEDRLTGETHTATCRHIVYAAGPWLDTLPEAPGAGRLLRPTKGVHVVVAAQRLDVRQAVVMSGVDDGRVVFALPWQGSTYIGTTDTDFDGDPDEIRATADDVAYLLETTNHFFPEADLTSEDIQSSWAGLRPLVRSKAATAYKTSREHRLFADDRGITTIAGGKLTTYRSMAKEVVDHVVKVRKQHTPDRVARCRTHRVPLDPDLPRPNDAYRGLDDPFEDMLWRHHGSRMVWVQERMASFPIEGEPVSSGLPYVMAQVSLAVLKEHARRLEDVMIRRLQLFFRAPDQGLAAAERIAKHMAALLEEGPAWVNEQRATYEATVAQSRMGARALSADGA